MAKVHILSPDVAQRIAAGEVIERPASVLKELIENSIDAAAQSITISLEAAGRRLIRVQDSGCGVAPEDIERLFHRHSTSKIAAFEDLSTLSTLGFRGEALYSIGAVADVLFRSRIHGASEGWELHVRGGERLGFKPCAMAEGTMVEVRELFFNTPARRKFLKTDSSEMRACLDVCIAHAIASPLISFTLSAGRTSLAFPSEEGARERMARVVNLPREQLFEVEQEVPEHHALLRIVAGDHNLQRPRKDLQFVIVSGRPVSSKAISFAINRAYEAFIPPGKYGCFAVFLTIPSSAVDVNIHPTKREVKIAGESTISRVAASCIAATIASRGTAKAYLLEPRIGAQSSRHFSVSRGEPSPLQQRETPVGTGESAAGYLAASAQVEALFPGIAAGGTRVTSLRESLSRATYLGSFRQKYLLFEGMSALLVIDQHAAHERVTYEALKRQIEQNRLEVQQMLMPLLLKLSPQEMLAWKERNDLLAEMGFSSTAWGEGEIAVYSHPQVISTPEDAVRSLLAEEAIPRADKAALARRACRRSLMAGTSLTRDEAETLKKALLACEEPLVCPHGRPTVIALDEHSLARQFLRKA